MKRNKKRDKIKILKLGIIIFVIIAIIIGIIIIENIKKIKSEEITLNNLPKLEYTEDEAKAFYSKKLINYLDMFKTKFHIKYEAKTIDENGTTYIKNEELSRKGDLFSIYDLDTDERLLIDNDYFYRVDEFERLIYKFKREENMKNNLDIIFYSLQDINENFVRTGNEEINSNSYYFEEYKMKSDTNLLIRYYFDQDFNIMYIKTYQENATKYTLFTISMLENEAYDFMFDLSDSYETMDLTENKE